MEPGCSSSRNQPPAVCVTYAKLTEEQMVTVVKDAIAMDNIDSENLWFKKSIIKMRTNQSTWKHRILGAIHVSINVY